MKKASKDDKLFLSALLSEFTDYITKSELNRKIESVQLSGFKRWLKKRIDFVRIVINYGITAALNVINDVVRCHYAFLPPIQESQIKDIIPKVNMDFETEFNVSEPSYKLLIRICSLAEKLGYNRVVTFFDKFDEDGRMENNAETIAEFIKPLVTDNKLLETPNIQIIISVWEVPFLRLQSVVRTQKHYCPILTWSIPKLKTALSMRLKVFSEGEIDIFQSIFADDVKQADIDVIFRLCNGNPRDLWHILNHIFQAQYIANPNSNKLTTEAISYGLRDFVVKFNFYEYYPKKARAKANTMDI